MNEGPGHVPLQGIRENAENQSAWCDNAPFYTLGPLPTDVAAGYDHVNSAIGGAIIAWHGVSMLCYVTPKEHLGLPNRSDVREGVVAHKVAAHAADIAREHPLALTRDIAMSLARRSFNWDVQYALSLDPERARSFREESAVKTDNGPTHYCSMCGPRYCAMEISRQVREND
jgi:phosphomethylpyrimidine synthase